MAGDPWSPAGLSIYVVGSVASDFLSIHLLVVSFKVTFRANRTLKGKVVARLFFNLKSLATGVHHVIHCVAWLVLGHWGRHAGLAGVRVNLTLLVLARIRSHLRPQHHWTWHELVFLRLVLIFLFIIVHYIIVPFWILLLPLPSAARVARHGLVFIVSLAVVRLDWHHLSRRHLSEWAVYVWLSWRI